MDRDLVLFITCLVFILAFIGYAVFIWRKDRAIFIKESEQSNKEFEETLRQIWLRTEKGHDDPDKPKLKLVINYK